MAETKPQQDDAGKNPGDLAVRQTGAPSTLLAGIEKFVGSSGSHTGIAVYISSNTELSTLMIPDLGTIGEGPVYITKPVVLAGDKLKAFLKKKGVDLPDPVANLVEDTSISCEAFYYTKSGPLIMMFALKFDKGLLTSLVGDDLGALFDIKGAAVRVLRCPDKDSLAALQKYAADLSA